MVGGGKIHLLFPPEPPGIHRIERAAPANSGALPGKPSSRPVIG